MRTLFLAAAPALALMSAPALALDCPVDRAVYQREDGAEFIVDKVGVTGAHYTILAGALRGRRVVTMRGRTGSGLSWMVASYLEDADTLLRGVRWQQGASEPRAAALVPEMDSAPLDGDWRLERCR